MLTCLHVESYDCFLKARGLSGVKYLSHDKSTSVDLPCRKKDEYSMFLKLIDRGNKEMWKCKIVSEVELSNIFAVWPKGGIEKEARRLYRIFDSDSHTIGTCPLCLLP